MEPDPIEIVTLKAKIAVDAGFANEMAQFCNSTVPVGATSGTIDLSCDAGVAAANNVGAALLSAGGSTLTMADVKEVQITYEMAQRRRREINVNDTDAFIDFEFTETMNVTVIDEAMTSLSALTPLDITVPGKNGTFIDAEVPGQEIVVTSETTSTPSCYNTNGDTVPKTPFTNANISALAEFLVNTSNAVRCADTSQMTSFENLFSGQTPRALDRSLAGLDTSTITNMDGAFKNQKTFVGLGVETWNMSAVTSARSMFETASSFNGNVAGWGMSRVENAELMFYSASNFTGTGTETWTMPALVNAGRMFMFATSFNGNVTGWGLNNVNNTNGMFYSASSFIGHGVETWDLSEVKDAVIMFDRAWGFDGNVAGWNMSRVENARRMFAEAWNFTGTGVETWAMPALVNAEQMFYGATSFNGNVTGWGLEKLQTARHMFVYATEFVGNGVETWDLSEVTDATCMFCGVDPIYPLTASNSMAFNGDVTGWGLEKLQTARHMFAYATEFVGNGVETWDLTELTNAEGMFLAALDFNGNVAGWGLEKLQIANGMFQGAIAFTGTGVETWNLSEVTDATCMFCGVDPTNGLPPLTASNSMAFNGNVTGWGLEKLQTARHMFVYATEFVGNGVETWDLSEVTDMGDMFMRARGFDGNVAGWNMSRVKNAQRMFAEAWNFTGTGVETWAMPALVNAEKMFYGATSFNGDVTGWGLEKLQTARHMFAYATKFVGNGVETWVLPEVTDSAGMFLQAAAFNGDVTGWGMYKLATASGMFSGASNFTGIGIDTWNVNNVTNANGMFYDAVLFNGDLEQWCMDPAVTSTTNMFDGVAPEATPCWYSGALPCCGAAAPTPRPTAAVTPPPTGSPTGGVEAPSGGGGGDDHTAAYVGGGVAALVILSAAGYVYATSGKTDGVVLKM